MVKVEKVVKEPKKPIAKKSCKDLENSKFSAIKKPIKKQPIILTIKVLMANPKIEKFPRRFERKNLVPAPRPPPIKIKR